VHCAITLGRLPPTGGVDDRFWSGREQKTLVIIIDLLRAILPTELLCSTHLLRFMS
jgi:hypothetical protein